MSQFSLEAEIQSALRLDSSINVQKSSMSRPVGRGGGGSVLNVSGKQFNASGLNRSRSESRLHTALFGGGGGGVAANNSLRQQRRSGSRGRTGSLLDLSSTGGNSAGSSKSPGRMCSDRFIPNRSTTDMEFAQHSLSRYFVFMIEQCLHQSYVITSWGYSIVNTSTRDFLFSSSGQATS